MPREAASRLEEETLIARLSLPLSCTTAASSAAPTMPTTTPATTHTRRPPTQPTASDARNQSKKAPVRCPRWTSILRLGRLTLQCLCLAARRPPALLARSLRPTFNETVQYRKKAARRTNQE
ncbi:hypothetical protein B0H17DRAFT_1334714 [Mycena rosella]|uniref:Uncharacterized protein n=1 Tax=Mycena rosella TaxID=1033263 RepID=A0AAD7GA72_MYCRO|nr:hypothetical protein B0H17DRAFT_1334714 [Mycena rosella]